MSKIEWTEKTWNPIVGCSIVSPGCAHCYAMRMAHRLAAMGVPHYQGLTKVVNGNVVWTGKLNIAPDHIVTEPLRRQKPTMWFVNSMSDLFHEDVPDQWIDRIFAAMALCPQHTFQVLTKRSERMREYFADPDTAERICGEASWEFSTGLCSDQLPPLPNVWLGVSAERQQEADTRIPDLLATPATVRFVSAEPLLSHIDFKGWLTAAWEGDRRRQIPAPRVTWVIVGGESGPDARPFDLAWARRIRSQCAATGVACFIKQVGSHPVDSERGGQEADGSPLRLRTKSKKGGNPAEWPAELRVREMPRTAPALGAAA